MDILKMDPYYLTAYAGVVEKYESIIWTERYTELSEFEIKSSDIPYMMTKLPLGAIITRATLSGQRSSEIMVVENHIIAQDAEGHKTITVSGRSVLRIMEGRTNIVNLNTNPVTPETVIKATSISDAIYAQLRNIFSWSHPSASENIPNLAIWNNAPRNTPLSDFQFRAGQADGPILEYLRLSGYGLRAIIGNGWLGEVLNYIFEIYNGVDKTSSVVFDHSRGHFTETSYLFSTKNYKSGGYGYDDPMWIGTYARADAGSGGAGGGWNRFMLNVDADDTNPTAYSPELIKNKTLALLATLGKVTAFDFKLSPTVPFKINVDYSVGDIVKVQGEYGVNKNMRVSEFVWIEDHEGERAYPGLSIINNTG